ncbi:dsDNA nuclease domain-containing protein [Paenarthrobacter sp. NPDC089714]|uniref:dsDNA nuclease domain-containing protein n=1 Tax=Paenarthrobacter sp. NPDC089714 TaxID=3364377 RepID=UPI00381C1771
MSDVSGGVPGVSSTSLDPVALSAFAGLPSDPTGTVTFQRFVWQAKISVRNWLVTLAPNGPIAIVCEHVEDLVVVERNMLRFAQLKTRDRGSWTASRICKPGHAVNTLVKSYLAATAAGIVSISKFEVWLEGPQSEDADTVVFFGDPRKAPERIKQKIRAMGLAGAKLKDFLSRLEIRCQQPSRESVDAVIMKAIGAAWPQLSYSQVETLYERLLSAATAAQSSSVQQPTVRAAVEAARLNPEEDNHWEPIRAQSLTKEQLRALCPPLNSDSNEQLLRRAASGEASLLELKLVRAGAQQGTIAAAKLARADAEVAATSFLAAGDAGQAGFHALDQRILSMADSLLALSALNGTSLTRPAEFIYHSLMSRPTDVNATDAAQVYGGDHRLVVGHLCNVSDQCRFSWGLS